MQDVNTCFVLYNMIISESSVKIMKLVSTVMNIYIICLYPPTRKCCIRSQETTKDFNVIDS